MGRCKLARPIIDTEDYEEYLPSTSKPKVRNPIEKLRQYKIKRQGYQPIVNQEQQYYVPKEVVIVPKKVVNVLKNVEPLHLDVQSHCQSD